MVKARGLPDDKELEKIDYVWFLRQISLRGESLKIIQKLRRFDIKIVFDVDDYWHLPRHHHLYPAYKKNMVPEQTEECLSLADHVTTTTEHLASLIRPFNHNVHVIPNALDEKAFNWQRREIKNRKVRIGWIGGVHHREDLKILQQPLWSLFNNGVKDYQICLGGFNADTSEYITAENIFTCKLKHLRDDPAYVEYLNQMTPLAEHMSYNKRYRRIWARSVDAYGQMYNEIDVALAPLEGDDFSACKSQLKMIEAGIMRKAFVCSDVIPYREVREHDIGLACSNAKEWTEALKDMIAEAELRQDYAAALHEYVKEKYTISKVNEKRISLMQ